jgi:hypothetical protein
MEAGVMNKKIIAFIALFLLVDRFLYYKLDQARYYARIEFLKKKKIARKSGLPEKRLAQSKQPGKNLATQESKSGTTTC